MAQLTQLETQVQVKASPDKFYGFFKNNMNRFTQMFPENIKSYELLGGGEIRAGCVTSWKYSLAGSPIMTAKAKVEALDDARKFNTFDIIKGENLKLYKSFKATIQVVAEYAKWYFEFEKASQNVPGADHYTEIGANLCKGIDAYLCK